MFWFGWSAFCVSLFLSHSTLLLKHFFFCFILFQKLLLTFGWSHMFRIGFFVVVVDLYSTFSLLLSHSFHVVVVITVVCFVCSCYICSCCCCLLPFVVVCLSQLSSPILSLFLHTLLLQLFLSITCIYIIILSSCCCFSCSS